MSHLNAPWSREVVEALWIRQADPNRHPYTCPYHGGAPLVPEYGGWRCRDENCDYRQEWAYLADVVDKYGNPR